MKTYAEQIAALEATKAAKSAALNAIQAKVADEGRTKDASEQEEFDNLKNEMNQIVKEINDVRELEALDLQTIKPVTDPVDEKKGDRAPLRTHAVPTKKLAPGTAFTRFVGALANARGSRIEAAEFAKRWKDSTPEVESILRMPMDLIEKVAVSPGTTTDSVWAAPLVQYQNMASEFIEYLRPLTIIGQINGFRRVPFKIRVPRQTAGASVNWVGEAKVKPVSSLAFDSVTMDITKIAGIIPLSEELVRFSDPSAEALVRQDLADAITQFMDREFLDPTKAATDVSPASVTNGVTPTQASGTTAAALRLDVKTMFATLLGTGMQIRGGTWVMTQQQALAISMMQNALGGPEFPGLSMSGGTFLGFPVVVSENIVAAGGSPTDGYPIVFILPGEILLADDGGVTIDMSREATLQMETAPDSPVTASTVPVSLWQHNLIAIKAERFINWKPRRSSGAVGIIQGAKYAE